MTLALCIPQADSFALWQNTSISDLDLVDMGDDDCMDFELPLFEYNSMPAMMIKSLDAIPANMSLKDIFTGPPSKRQRIAAANPVVSSSTSVVSESSVAATDADSLLHHACCKSNTTVADIQAILSSDPHAATRAMRISTTKTVYDYAKASRQVKLVKETYTYPLNLAIHHKVSQAVIALLMDAAPSVLLLRDGPQDETTLLILLKHAPHDCALLDQMLLQTPQCALLSDRKNNTCLHVACRYHAPLIVVRQLAILHPRALSMTNHWHQTPLDVVQASSAMATDDVSVYLWERQSHECQ